MFTRWRRWLLVALSAIAVLAANPGAVALGATASTAPPPLLDSLARQLRIPPSKLEAAVRSAALQRLDTLAKERNLPADQVQSIRNRITQDPITLSVRFGQRAQPVLTAAATYLGLTPAALAAELHQGKSLAEIAQAQGKTRTGLKDALVAALQARINARTDLTPEARKQALDHLDTHVEQILDRHVTPATHHAVSAG